MESNPPDWDVRSAELARESLDVSDPLGWFDRLYTEGVAGKIGLPWDRQEPLPQLTDFLERHAPKAGARVLVVGCGLGIDAEYMGQMTAGNATVTAFDLSSTAIDIASSRYPESHVNYQVADLFHPPSQWLGYFDLVVEIINLQALTRSMRAEATKAVTDFLAPGGTLFVVENVADEVGSEDDDTDSSRPPWPFTRAEMEMFTESGLHLCELTKEMSTTTGVATTVPRWRGVFRRNI